LDGRDASEFSWAPTGARLGFLLKDHADSGVTSFYVQDAQKRTPDRLVDGNDLALGGLHASLEGYQWSPDGSTLLLARDSGLALYDLKGHTLRSLTDGEATFPSFSPDGRHVAFVRGGNLFVVEVQTRTTTQLTRDGADHVFNGRLDWVYQEELSNRGGQAYEWSPDGLSIAYIRLDENRVPSYPLVDFLETPHPSVHEQRYPNPGDPNAIPSVHVVDLEGREKGKVEFPAADDLYVVPELSWLPDSQGVAYQTLDRSQTDLKARILSLPAGKTSLLFEEHDPYWINVPDRINSSTHATPLRFLKGGRYLWLSERSGYNHLYLGSVGHEGLTPLTRGNWAVDGVVGVDEAGGWVYFVSSEQDARERQIDRVRLDGTGFARLTTEPGVHSGQLSPDGNHVFETRSSLVSPTSARLLSPTGKTEVEVDEPKNRLGEFDLPKAEFVEVKASDGTRLFASLLKPPNFDPKKVYPVVVRVYGGPHVQLVRNEFPRLGVHEVLASKGFLVWTLDNRGSWGRGHAFETPIFKDMGRVELADQLEGIRYLKTLPYVDASRIGLTGWSYGGYMTLYAMTHAPGVFKCAAAGAPVVDWTLYDSIYTERYMRTPKDNPEGYKTSSPLKSASALKGYLLLIHGTADDNVHTYNTINFVHELIKSGTPYELKLGPGERHGFRAKPNQDARDLAIVSFFERHL
jgi:dipeptidyl-peptidase-4